MPKIINVLFIISMILGPAILGNFCFFEPGAVDFYTRKVVFIISSTGYWIGEAVLYLLTKYIYR